MFSFVNQYHSKQFSWFRTMFGLYLIVLFGVWLPYATEIFSNQGIIPFEYAEVILSPLIPQLLYEMSSPLVVQVLLVSMMVGAGLLALGWRRRTIAFLLWIGWMWVSYLNPLSSDPAQPFIGLLLLTLAVVPNGTASSWNVPRVLFFGLYAVIAIGFSISGFEKLHSELWFNGTAVHHFCTGYVHASNPVTTLCAAAPFLSKLATWVSLYSQLLAVPLVLFTYTRRLWWLITTLSFIGVSFVIATPLVTVGILLFLFFIMERWWYDRFSDVVCLIRRQV